MTRRQERPKVFVLEAGVWGRVLKRGAYVSLVEYNEGGMRYEVYLENDEFIERDVEE